MPVGSSKGTPAITVSSISGNTTESSGTATFTIKLGSSPASNVNICILSSDTANGGTIQTGNGVNAADGTCTSSAPYAAFTSSNWENAMTITVVGSRGTLGVMTNTNYSLSFSVVTSDPDYSSLSPGTISLTNTNVDAPGSYNVLLTLSGLTGGTLVLQNNGTNNLSLTANGTFPFTLPIVDGNTYSVSILSQPSGLNCAIAGTAFGTIASADVTLTASCVPGYIFNGVIASVNPFPTLTNLTNLTTLAGSLPVTVASGNTDATGGSARFNQPIAITADGTNVYVAEVGNNTVRKMNKSTNAVTTLANVTGPHGVATDGVNVYVTSYNQHVVRKIVIATGTVTILAGQSGSSGDVDAIGGAARFNQPTYLTTDGTYVYVSDRLNDKIKKINIATGAVTTVLSVTYPNGITTDGTYLYVAESNANIVSKINLSTLVKTTVAGGATGGGTCDGTAFADCIDAVGTAAQFNTPYGLTIDGTYIYVFEGAGKKIRKIDRTTAQVTTIVKNTGYSDGAVATAQICNGAANCDSSITTDGSVLFIADRYTHSIRKIGP